MPWTVGVRAVRRITSRTLLLGRAQETDSARAMVLPKTKVLGRAIEIDTARPVTARLATSGFMLIDQATLMSLAISGTAWTTMKASADVVSKGTPNLSLNSGYIVQGRYLASAIVYARIGGANYKNEVVQACRDVMGTEDDGTDPNTDNTLRPGRQLAGWIWAADFVGMDKTLTGTRTGYTTTTWAQWLENLITKTLPGKPSTWDSIDNTSKLSGNNHGSWNLSAYAAIACYLNLASHKTAALNRFKSYIGDRTVTRTQVVTAAPGDADWTWVCLPTGFSDPLNDYRPQNNAAPCVRASHSGNLNADGAWFMECHRELSAYPTMGSEGINNYYAGATQAMLCAALSWKRSGYSDIFTWQSNWLKRSIEFMNRQGYIAEFNTTAGKRPVLWCVNNIYGTSYPTVATIANEHSLTWTDWLFPPAPAPTVTTIAFGADIAPPSTDSFYLNGATSDLVVADSTISAVLALGDNAYGSGTLTQYNGPYDATWGRFKAKTYPIPGNHEYFSSNISANYGTYWGSKANPQGGTKYYYTVDIGGWHFMFLDSDIQHRGTSAAPAQLTWMDGVLAGWVDDGKPVACALHHNRFSNGGSQAHGANTAMAPFYTRLYTAKCDLIIHGHNHYADFSPRINASGSANSLGYRVLCTGTGGHPPDNFGASNFPSDFSTLTRGIGKLYLSAHSYEVKYFNTSGTQLYTTGSVTTHK